MDRDPAMRRYVMTMMTLSFVSAMFVVTYWRDANSVTIVRVSASSSYLEQRIAQRSKRVPIDKSRSPGIIQKPGNQSRMGKGPMSGGMSPQQAMSVENMNMQRKRQIVEKCPQLVPNPGNFHPEFNMFADDKYKYMVCLMFKSTCPSWLKMLTRSSTTTSDQRERANRFLRPLQSYKPGRIEEIRKNNFKFMFVRHPFERLVSAYYDRFHSLPKRSQSALKFHNLANDIKRKYRRPYFRGKVTFPEFIRFLLDPTNAQSFDHHWLPYYQLCQPCQLKYDFIGHYETYHEDVAHLLKRMKLDKKVLATETAADSCLSSTRAIAMLSRVPEANIKRLYEMYRVDFELFGYKWPQ